MVSVELEDESFSGAGDGEKLGLPAASDFLTSV